MRFCPGTDPVSPVKIGARVNIIHRFGKIDEGNEVQERQRVQRSIHEAGVGFTPFIARKGAGMAILQAGDI